MFERILIPLDGSPRAEVILGQVARILRREDSEILLLRVVNDRREGLARTTEAERDEAQRYLHDLVHRLALRGAKVHGRVAEGPPAATILDQAATEGATLIAMSTHGRTGLSRWIMGSVAEKVVRASPVPVLLLRSFRPTPQGTLEPATEEELPFRKILVPTDGSVAASAVVGPAGKFAQLFDSEVMVVHAELPLFIPAQEGSGVPPVLPLTPSEEDPLTAKAAERFRHLGLAVERRTVPGSAADVILDLSHAAGIDLLAMSTHGRSGISRWILGSVAERVLRHVGIPLLLVRADKESRRKTAGRKRVRQLKG